MINKIAFIILCASVFSQHVSKVQLVAKYEMNMSWISPSLPDSFFFAYDSFNYAGFSDLSTDCYDPEFDVIEPPSPLGNWSRLTFPHDDIGAGQCWANDFGVNNFTQDIRYKDDNYLQNNFLEWEIEFNASIPGRAYIYMINNDLWADCNLVLEYNNQEIGIEDTLIFWYQTFQNPPENLNFKIGMCSDLNIDESKLNNIKNFQITNVFPNPFNPNFTINYFNSINEILQLRIYDLKGHIIFDTKINSKIGNNKLTVEPNLISSGTYYLNLSNNTGNTLYVPIIYIK